MAPSFLRSSTVQVDVEWPSPAVVKFRQQRDQEAVCGLATKNSKTAINGKGRSLKQASDLTVQLVDINAGFKDIAELRSDGSGSFYSNFTPQRWAVPRCCRRCAPCRQCWSFWAFMISAAHHLLFNTEALAMAVTGVVSTFLCCEKILDFRATYQTSAIFIGLIFPLVFLIGQTWLRREKAVERLATIKANVVQLVLKLITHGENGPARAVKVLEISRRLIEEIGMYLPQDATHSGVRLSSIYGHVADLQREPECAMITRFMLVEFEKLRVQRDYRTPWILNYFCFCFGSASPFLCGPLFASMGCTDRFPARLATEPCGFGTPGAYVSAVFFSIVVSSMLAIVKSMEDPFSLDGADDVISSFSFEVNALLHLIEERAPGSLNAGVLELENKERWIADSPNMRASRQALTKIQHDTASASDAGSAEDGGDAGCLG